MSKQSRSFKNVKDEEKLPTRRRNREVAAWEKREPQIKKKKKSSENISLDQEKISHR